jgi:TolB protein
MFAFCLLALFACGGGPGPERIAFSSNRDGNYEVYIMNADGSGQTNLTNNPGEDDWPAWLPR